MPELMAVIAQGQRRLQIVGKRMKPREMVNPLVIIKTGKANSFGSAIIPPADPVLRETRRCYPPVEAVIEVEMDRGCLVTCHAAILS